MTEQEQKDLLSRNGFKTYKVEVVFVDSRTKETEPVCILNATARNKSQAIEKTKSWLYTLFKSWVGGDYKFKAKEIK